MVDVKSADDVYPALKELIPLLEGAGETRLATVLSHRLYGVAWTTRSELFEELLNVIRGAVSATRATMRDDLRHQLGQVASVIQRAAL
jgi:hypothetical protein